jgi:hypothetical protein
MQYATGLIALIASRHEHYTEIAESGGQFLSIVSIRGLLQGELLPESGSLTVLWNGFACGTNQAGDLGKPASGFNQLGLECAIGTVQVKIAPVKTLSVLQERGAERGQPRLIQKALVAYASEQSVDDSLSLSEGLLGTIPLPVCYDEVFHDASDGCEAECNRTQPERCQDRVSLHKLADVIDRPVTMCQEWHTFKVTIQIVGEVFG